MKEAEAYILGIPKFAAKIGTENLKQLMEKLGNPHLKIKTIHIAGTNGKGSVAEMLRCMLTAAGYRTGSFISPHLVSMRERFAVDGTLISDADFVKCYKTVREKAEEMDRTGPGHPSFFEFVFAMAAIYFHEQNVDYAIFETGMGGRLDATNLLKPQITVITSIGFDHMQYLGDTIEKIAFEKAGIIKEGTPVVYHTASREADRVIVQQADKRHAPLIPVEKSKVIINEKSPHTIDFSIENRYYSYYSLLINSGALYQVDNAGTAAAAFHKLLEGTAEEPQIEAAVRTGLKRFFWPGRMEYIRENIVVDGAHNEDAMARFVESVSVMTASTAPDRLKLLFAVSNDKDYETMIRLITETLSFHTIYITEINSVRGTAVDDVQKIFRKYLGKNHATLLVTGEESNQVLDRAEKELKKDELLFCVGSLYLVGEIKDYFGREKHDKL